MRTYLVIQVYDYGYDQHDVIYGDSFRDAVKRELNSKGWALGWCLEAEEMTVEELTDNIVEYCKNGYVHGDSTPQLIVFDVTNGIPTKVYPNDDKAEQASVSCEICGDVVNVEPEDVREGWICGSCIRVINEE